MDDFKFICICCEKAIELCWPNDPIDTIFPNLNDGGFIDIHCGYGSRYDMLPFMIDEYDPALQCAICDNCIQNKKKLTRMICRSKGIVIDNENTESFYRGDYDKPA